MLRVIRKLSGLRSRVSTVGEEEAPMPKSPTTEKVETVGVEGRGEGEGEGEGEGRGGREDTGNCLLSATGGRFFEDACWK
ncbi:hypothetical protein E2C01_085485 [Portunus trituberculatus]|uniref:Uncharacterized protein n=1 Tax=Portunus trituberculatus TaxID=210409 RepID=A0A5B7J906_PORTR|nr:hypothetical protein [Portunus trituberculatus]